MIAAEVLLHQDFVSSDVILMADEMYLQKGVQFHRGELVGANSDGELFDGIMVFMIVGLKKVKEDQKEIRKKKEIRKIHDQIRKIHERDQNLQACLRKAPKLSTSVCILGMIK